MQYREILEEGTKAFLPMYQGLPILDQNDIVKFIDKVEQKFVRKDRVTWFCRWHRIWYMSHVEAKLAQDASAESETDQHVTEEPVISEKTWRKLLVAVNPSITKEQAIEEANEVLSSLREYEHYLQLPIQGIKNIVWEKQSPDELLDLFREEEKEWQASLKENRAVRIRSQDEQIIDFGNGWAWWDLNRSGCREEGDAMGHCGNGGGSYNETVLSLRKKIDDFHYSPHLTFILQDGDTLGEMKGRNNEKPAAKYHKMIMALLLSDYVQDIKGGGYLPENNFSLDDLSDAEQAEIKEKKPSLRPAWELWREYENMVKEGEEPTDDYMVALQKKVENEASKYGQYSYIDWDTKEIIVESRSLNSYVIVTEGLVSMLSSVMDDLEDIIRDNAKSDTDSDNAELIAEAVQRDHYIDIVRELLPYDTNFRLNGMSRRLVKDDALSKEEVQTYIDVRDFLFEDEETLEYLDNFQDEYDMDEYYHVIEAFDDPIEVAFVNYVAAEATQNTYRSSGGGDPKALCDAILAEYGDDEARAEELNTVGHRRYTPTISHPDQMEFDFDKD